MSRGARPERIEIVPARGANDREVIRVRQRPRTAIPAAATLGTAVAILTVGGIAAALGTIGILTLWYGGWFAESAIDLTQDGVLLNGELVPFRALVRAEALGRFNGEVHLVRRDRKRVRVFIGTKAHARYLADLLNEAIRAGRATIEPVAPLPAARVLPP